MNRLKLWRTALASGPRRLAIVVIVAGAVLAVCSPAYALLPPDSSLRSNIVSWANYELTNTAHNRGFAGTKRCNFYSGYWGSGGACLTSEAPSGFRGNQWCADFAKYTWFRAGAYVSGLDSWADSFRTFGVNHGTFYEGKANGGPTYTPKAGDAVTFDWNPDSTPGGTDADGTPDTDHVGIIKSVSGDYIYTVEGNAGAPPGVISGSKSYNWKTDTRIVGYTQPLYP